MFQDICIFYVKYFPKVTHKRTDVIQRNTLGTVYAVLLYLSDLLYNYIWIEQLLYEYPWGSLCIMCTVLGAIVHLHQMFTDKEAENFTFYELFTSNTFDFLPYIF